MSKPISVKISTFESELEFSVAHNTRGDKLLDQVARTLNLRETWYFGLLFRDSKGYPSWLRFDRKISSQDVGKQHPLQFRFCVKYYPEEIEELIQDVTQRLFYLQVRSDILDGNIYCPPETCVLLASYACQVKYGDYKEEYETTSGEYMQSDRLLPERVIDQHEMEKEKWISTIGKMYRNHKDMLREEAIMEYLRLAQDLEMYGVNFFDITNRKGTELLLGVDALGLNIYTKDNKLTPTIGFPWSEIKNVSYNNKKFIIKSTERNNEAFIFFTPHSRICKLILNTAMGNHDMYLKRRKTDTIEIQQMKAQAEEERKFKLGFKDRIARERMAKEDTERKLADMENKLKMTNEMNEDYQQRIEDYERRIREMEEILKRSEDQERQLKEMQEEFEIKYKEMMEAKDNDSKEFERLQAEVEKMQMESQELNQQSEETKRELEMKKMELEESQKIKEDLESKLEQTEKQKEAEDSVTLGSMEFVDDRREEDRTTHVSKNEMLQNQLSELASDLRNVRDDNKMEGIDKIHLQNQKEGRDKFQTLKQIRQGNTKKRVDKFEAL